MFNLSSFLGGATGAAAATGAAVASKISSNGFERKFRRDLASSSVKAMVSSSVKAMVSSSVKSLVDIPPVFVFCAVVAPGLVDSGSLVTENGHRVFLWVWVWVWPVPYAGCAM